MKCIYAITLLTLASARSLCGKDSHKLQHFDASVSQKSENDVVDPSTIIGKHMTGYQAWYNCDEDKKATYHWKDSNVLTDILPDVTEYNQEDLCDLGITDKNGNAIKVFSSYEEGTVDLHFKWMRDYGIDGVFLQQFFSDLEKKGIKDKRIMVTEYVSKAAEKYGRTWALMFDLSGNAQGVKDRLAKYVNRFKQIIADSKMYLHMNGKPIIAVWGIDGDEDTHIRDPIEALEVINFLKGEGYSVYGGIIRSDFMRSRDDEKEWAEVYKALDVVSPWHIKGYRHDDRYTQSKKATEDGIAALNGTGTVYVPVIYPGKSGKNLRDLDLNWLPREGGNLYRSLGEGAIDGGAMTLYTAMFDEVNEGTAIYKTIPTKDRLPKDGNYIALDADGYSLPSDYYLTIAGNLTSKLEEKL